MKKNELSIGLKSNKKLKNSFYHFLVDNQIDWAIILGSVLCILPYLGSEDWYWIFSKSILLVTVVFLSLKYLKTWNTLRDTDNLSKKALEKLKNGIKKGDKISIEENLNFYNEFAEQITLLKNDFSAKTEQYKDLNEYLKYDKEIPPEIEGFLNKNKNLTISSLSISMGIILVMSELRVLPKMRLKNYYRILAIVFIVVVFFTLYTIEKSI